MSRWLRAWGPALLCAAAIFVASAQHTVHTPNFSHSDKVSHFAAYAVFGAALAHGGLRRGVAPLWLILAGSLYGVSDEVHQRFVPGRSSDPLDWVADSAGAAAGVLAFNLIHSRRRVRRGTAPGDADSVHP
ncbi:MAG TPA: VanZ family protein [Longimicrobium sp.]